MNRSTGHAAPRAGVALIARIMTGLLAGVVALTACDSPASPPAKPFAIKSSSLTQMAGEILFNTYSAQRDAVASNNAMQLLIKSCMQSHNLIYFPMMQPEPNAAEKPSNPQEYPPYGTLPQRKVDGYGLAAVAARPGLRNSSGANPADPQDRYFDKLTQSAKAQYEQIEYGPSADLVYLKLPGGVITLRSGGCRGLAAARIFGSIRNYLLSVVGKPRYLDAFLHLVESSAPVVQALRGWSACMGRRGFRYTAPENAYYSIAQEYITGGPSRRTRAHEIKVAVADYQCASQVSLISITLSSQRKLATRLAGTALSPLLEIAQIDIYAASVAAGIWRPSR